jgi:hypothetical protein
MLSLLLLQPLQPYCLQHVPAPVAAILLLLLLLLLHLHCVLLLRAF